MYRSELPSLINIEQLYKKQKQSKSERLASVKVFTYIIKYIRVYNMIFNTVRVLYEPNTVIMDRNRNAVTYLMLSYLSLFQAGREDRGKYGRPKEKAHVGKTNKKLKRNKAFAMVRHKNKGRTIKKSFREKQIALKKHLEKLRKLK